MSLFNPWVILGLLLAFAGVGAGGYSKGVHSERDRQQIEIARLNNEARQKEQALVSAVTTQATQLVKANNDAKLAQQKRNADINNGSIKLRIPVKTVCPTLPTAPDAQSSSGSDTRTAEIQPETARAIFAIGDEADTTVRKLNACLAIYNQTREMINERK